MATILFDNGEGHRVIAFHDLVRGDDGIHANQYLIVHDGRGALIDPGGALLYTPLSLAVATGFFATTCLKRVDRKLGSFLFTSPFLSAAT